jgi:hypothetical protein
MVSALFWAIILCTSAICLVSSSVVGNELVAACTDRSVLLSIYLNIASVVSLPNSSDKLIETSDFYCFQVHNKVIRFRLL